MQVLRRAAFQVLRAGVRLAPASSRPWAAAMLAELHEVPGDFPALRWALGGVAALCWHACTHLHPVPRLDGQITSRRNRLAIAGAVLLLAALALASRSGLSVSRPANGGGPYAVTVRAP